MTQGLQQADAAPASSGKAVWRSALQIAAALAVDPVGLGGAHIRGPAGPARDRWFDTFASCLGPDAPIVPCPASIDAAGLFGGLDPAATLALGRPEHQKGALARADGGVLIARSAERLTAGAAAAIAQCLDTGRLRVERDGLSSEGPAAFAALLFDEGFGVDEQAPGSLRERLAFAIDLSPATWRDCEHDGSVAPAVIEKARALFPHVVIGDDVSRAMLAAAAEVGVEGARPLLFCHRAARAFASLDGRRRVEAEDARLASQLVLGPRAGKPAPAPAASDDGERAQEKEPENDHPSADAPDASEGDGVVDDLAEMIIAAALGGGLDFSFARPGRRRRRTELSDVGKSGARIRSLRNGRVVGARPRAGASAGKINILETLKAAAPWQTIRQQTNDARVRILPSDLRVSVFERRLGSSVIFVVDASGSAAFERLAETKGAVERLLQDCYSRRDHVSVIAFRGGGADLILPPTHALVRARRALVSLPGGGGTPLATAIAAADDLARREDHRGRTPCIVVLSDGGANINARGEPGRKSAHADAMAAAKRVAARGVDILFFDTGRRPSASAREIAGALGAIYRPMPYAGGAAVSQTIAATIAQAR